MDWLWLRRMTRKVRSFRPRLLDLEDRRLPAVSGLTATIEPDVLAPPSGRFVPLTITGTVRQAVTFTIPGRMTEPPSGTFQAKIDARNEAVAPPPGALIQVTDDFRIVQPRLYTGLRLTDQFTFFSPASRADPSAHSILVRDFEFSKRIYLRASTLTTQPVDRHYYVSVAVTDHEGSSGQTLPVVVPSPASKGYPSPRGPLAFGPGPAGRPLRR